MMVFVRTMAGSPNRPHDDEGSPPEGSPKRPREDEGSPAEGSPKRPREDEGSPPECVVCFEHTFRFCAMCAAPVCDKCFKMNKASDRSHRCPACRHSFSSASSLFTVLCTTQGCMKQMSCFYERCCVGCGTNYGCHCDCTRECVAHGCNNTRAGRGSVLCFDCNRVSE